MAYAAQKEKNQQKIATLVLGHCDQQNDDDADDRSDQITGNTSSADYLCAAIATDWHHVTFADIVLASAVFARDPSHVVVTLTPTFTRSRQAPVNCQSTPLRNSGEKDCRKNPSDLDYARS